MPRDDRRFAALRRIDERGERGLCFAELNDLYSEPIGDYMWSRT
jgi:hypothetical protein